MTDIPDKLFFKIGEVSTITRLEPHILRYWETEFQVLSPRKNESGQRLYIKRDIETILKIKKLLHEEGYTILGAKKLLTKKNKKPEINEAGAAGQKILQQSLDFERKEPNLALREIKEDLKAVLSLLSHSAAWPQPK
ncbi:MAG: MerR family transcriptional regulator [Nitrospinae bacterium]|nr:MerR family transcriptional regulator [Nitrospinota bacterium]